MKKGKFFYSLIFSIFILFSCVQSFTPASKIQVQTSAKYNFSIAQIDKDFSDFLKPKTILESIKVDGQNLQLDLYDYNPRESLTTQSYVLRLPFQEIPLDFNSYMNSLDIGKDIQAMNFTQEVEIPSININHEQDIDVSAINALIISLVSLNGTTGTAGSVLKINFNSFDTVNVKSGDLIITTTATGNVSLYSKEGLQESEVLASTPIQTKEIKDGIVSFNVSNKTIYADNSFLVFETADSGKSFIGTLSPSTKVNSATGVNGNTDEISLGTTTFPVNLGSDTLQSCIFGADSSISVDFIVPGVTNYTITKNIVLSEGLNVTINSEGETSLENKEFFNKDIKADISLNLVFNNSTIDLTKGSPKIKLVSSLQKMKSVTIKVPNDLQTEISQNLDLPEAATKAIKQINWEKGCGMVVEYINTFPTNNDFNLKNVKSDFLGLTDSNATLQSNTTTKTKIDSLVTTEEKTTTISDGQKVDFSAKFELPNYNSSDNTFTVNNVELGKKYKIELDVKPVFDWKSILVKIENINNLEGSTSLQINPKSVLGSLEDSLGLVAPETLSDKLKLSSLKIHLFCERPDIPLFNSSNFSGTILFSIGSANVYFLNNETMPLTPEPKMVMNKNGTVISSISGGVHKDISSLVNNMGPDDDIVFNYALNFGSDESGEIEIFKEDLENANTTSMKIIADIIFPLDFKLENSGSAFNLDVMKIAQKTYSSGDADFFNRTEATQIEGFFGEIIDVIESVSVKYNSKEIPIKTSKPVAFKIDLDGQKPGGDGASFAAQILPINGGSFTEGPTKFLENLVYPSAHIVIPEGQISIPRNALFNTNLSLSINCSGKPVTVVGD